MQDANSLITPASGGAAKTRPVSAADRVAHLQTRLARQPDDPQILQDLGHALVQNRQLADAVRCFENALKAGGDPARQLQAHAIALSNLNRQQDAANLVRPAYEAQPDDANLANIFGVILKRAGALDVARKVLAAAHAKHPQNVMIAQNLGNVAEMQGDHAATVAAFHAVLRSRPDDPEMLRLYGRALAMSGDNVAALAPLQQAMQRDPESLAVLMLLAQVLLRLKRPQEAFDLVEPACKAHSKNEELAVLSARVLYRLGQLETARARLNAVLAMNPGHLGACLLLSQMLGDGDRASATAVLERALHQNPRSWEAADALVDSLSRSRYGREADHIEAAYQVASQLLANHPDRLPYTARSVRTALMRVVDEPRMAQSGDVMALLPGWLAEGRHSSVHYELGQLKNLDERVQMVEWHRAWGRRVQANLRPVTPLAMPALASGRKLRIGFMSSDLRNHPVTYFTLPLLERYDRDRVEVFCYSFYEGPQNPVQTHIQSQVTGFRLWPSRPDAEVAEGIAADGLDMLFELGGSTAMNKLEVMAYRPARLGASWLGYPHSAGLESIDYILVDPYLKPSDPRLLIEKPFEMPETWVTLGRLGFVNFPIADDTPQERRGYLTFGTANNPYKITPACLDLWARVMCAVPDSRFLFLRPEAAAPSFITNVSAAFERRGVAPDRLEFVGIRGQHMEHYNKIDIALDSLPHVGGTTTCEALWMGVPTVTLVGPGFPERLSYSNLSNAGLGDLATFVPDDYVAKATELAQDLPRRRHLRHGLRAQIAAHPLGQPDRFVQNFYRLAAEVSA